MGQGPSLVPRPSSLVPREVSSGQLQTKGGQPCHQLPQRERGVQVGSAVAEPWRKMGESKGKGGQGEGDGSSKMGKLMKKSPSN